MKKTILIAVLLLSGFAFKTATAQIKIRANIGAQPVWGPIGYDHVEYYYMPDIDAYYYVPTRQYIYQERGRWLFATALPRRYHNYDVYNGYKVVVNDPKPYRNAQNYRTTYAPYKGRHNQEIIRNSHDARYFEVKDHPEHNKWRDERVRNDKKGNHNNHP